MEEIMADDTFLSDYFHEESLGKVKRFYRRRSHCLYPGMDGGNVGNVAEVQDPLQIEELLNKLPSLQK